MCTWSSQSFQNRTHCNFFRKIENKNSRAVYSLKRLTHSFSFKFGNVISFCFRDILPSTLVFQTFSWSLFLLQQNSCLKVYFFALTRRSHRSGLHIVFSVSPDLSSVITHHYYVASWHLYVRVLSCLRYGFPGTHTDLVSKMKPSTDTEDYLLLLLAHNE